MCISIETKTENHCSTTSSFSNNRSQVELSNEVHLFAIGRFSKAGLLEWMRFVIFRERSRERSQRTSGLISE